MSNYIRFDWAMKRLLRNKASFVVLEGFLTTLLEENIKIERLLESEGNKEDERDKFNRVDLLAENSRGELIIVEIQNNRELDYFHRMLYGTSKAITEYIVEGQAYGVIRKVYSVNIVYFDLGQGNDYVYKGKTEFIGLHNHEILKLSASQRKQFMKESVGDLYPEYYVLRVDGFDDIAHSPLDEWISFLKTGDIPDTATASGLAEAREILRRDKLTRQELADYNRDMEALRYQKSVITTGYIEGKDDGFKEGVEEGRELGREEGRELGREEGRERGREEGIQEGKYTTARNLIALGIDTDTIAKATGLTTDEITLLKQ
ncbi:MAG: Rpn family recombination-promoting nuclease/putative transposase [Phocaeicola sp.]